MRKMLMIWAIIITIFNPSYSEATSFEDWMAAQTGVWSHFKFCPLAVGAAKIRTADACAKEGGGFSARRGQSRTHGAIDLESTRQTGADIYAIGAGVVGLIGDWPNMGKLIIIDHGEGVYSLYSHLGSISVAAKQQLKGGEKLGTIGYSGNASCLVENGLAAHVHFAVFRSGFADEAGLAKRIYLWQEYGRMKRHFKLDGFGPLNAENWLRQNACLN